WGAAVLAGDGARAGEQLRRAAALGEALRRRPGGDQTLWDQVRAIRTCPDGAALRTLAAAHRAYATGRALYEAAEYDTAAVRLRTAAASGSPALALWAELYLAIIR